ncbi:PD40 domain-containing protein [Kitasatospora sp. SUK 42]|uniref:TolB family protein n=1 Tax=Kitasatospora sp. SUK 42 TaxID=1588882 RepID=UPI0018C8FC9F|nr:PD40 domain-containing protein [Kitasatospora sp. SUK 42]MBV2153126.1 PD40 domain-containing protein [Kitasatospora sp. SUK 42]
MTTARTRRWLARAAAVLAVTAVAGAAMPGAEARPPKGDTARVSEGPKGEQLNGPSHALGLSEDGRSALFTTTATNLLPQEGTPNLNEIYVRDLRNGHIERVSVADDGSQLNGMTFQASISGDGRYVAFSTSATNVVPGQPKHLGDVFVRDRWTGRTELVSAGGLPGTGDQSPFDATSPSISRDGRYVAYVSDRGDLAPGGAGGTNNVYVTDRWTHTSRLVSVGADGRAADANSFSPTISADGSTVGFGSRAENLLPDAPAASAEAGAPGLARRPRYYPYYVWKADTGRITGASLDGAGRLNDAAYGARISPDGRYAVYSLLTGRGNARLDAYVHELATGRLTQVNAGLPGTTANGDSSGGVMTADGRWVYFESDSDNLVPGDTNHAYDVFRRDLRTGRIERVSLTADGSQSTASSHNPYVDATGDTVVFDASDGDLVPGDTNILQDVFLRRL